MIWNYACLWMRIFADPSFSPWLEPGVTVGQLLENRRKVNRGSEGISRRGEDEKEEHKFAR